MNIFRRWFLTSFAGSTILLAALIWIFFAPTQLGGQVNYIIIDGNSMEPLIHKADVIIVRQAQEYKTGDAAAYWNPLLTRYVFHRIVSADLGRFTFKGDHNAWLDSYQPIQSELVGKQWIVLPHLGKAFEWIRRPVNLALIIAALGGILMAFILKRNKKTHGNGKAFDPIAAPKEWFLKMRKQSSNNHHVEHSPRFNDRIEIGFFVLGLIALGSIVLGAFAFLSPLSVTTTQNLTYAQNGTFTYSADAPSGVYDLAGIQAGDPIFTRLTCQIDLGFDYALSADGLQSASGTHQFTAVLTEMNTGWRRTFPLEAEQSFSGSEFSTRGTLDICQMQSLAEQMEQQTGVTSSVYQIVVYPDVDISGVLQDVPFSERFSTPLTFQFDKVHASLIKTEPGSNPLHPTSEAVIPKQIIQSKVFAISFIDLPVSTARKIAIAGLTVSFLGLIGLMLLIGNTSKHDPEAFIRMKYSSILVDVEPDSMPIDVVYVDVSSIDDLARLAEKNSSVILHQHFGSQHVYQVQIDHLTYRNVVISEGSTDESEN